MKIWTEQSQKFTLSFLQFLKLLKKVIRKKLHPPPPENITLPLLEPVTLPKILMFASDSSSPLPFPLCFISLLFVEDIHVWLLDDHHDRFLVLINHNL